MSDAKTRRLVSAALFTALTCAATAFLCFPTALGNCNAGDAVVLLGAFLLGPFWGALAAGVGSAMADFLAGYVIYAPFSLIIKGLMALCAGFLLRRGSTAIAAAICAELIMVAGYFLCEFFILGYGSAAIGSLPPNAIQAVFGAAAGCALFYALRKTGYLNKEGGHEHE